jgi:hypothetical protein
VIEMKILKEDCRMNMSTKLSSNLPSAIFFIREDDWNVKAYGRR